jgi:Acyl-CoA dehydrogenases
MGNKLVDLRDARFVMYEQLNVTDLFKYERFNDHSEETIEMAVKAAEKLAVNEYYPINSIGDQIGVIYENGSVSVPKVYHPAYKKFCAAGWTAPNESYEVGGQQLPLVVNFLGQMLFFAANQSLMVYSCLTHSAGKVVDIFGTEEQKDKYLEAIYSGRYQGCMDLTEPQAGSDVGAVRTKAIPNVDGTYSIIGNKIFISGGDTDLTENTVHILLARVEGDPEGTKGLSCFIVPKVRINDDGSLGENNDVVCTGVEHKTGMKGSATCSLAYGDNHKCIGELLGERGKGIVTMFHMMNEQRVVVGLEGHAMSSSAYLHALEFARERKQGAALGQKAGNQVPIIDHPDVRKNLLIMKSYTEGIRALLLYTAHCMDLMDIAEDEAERQKYSDLVEILTPICKAHSTEKSFDVCVTAVQVHGGYGYCQDYYVEQLMRDCKITSIYEGTNGIQANDLLGRKIIMRNGAAFQTLIAEMKSVTKSTIGMGDLSTYAADMDGYVDLLIIISDQLRTQMIGNNSYLAYSWASQYLNIFGDIVLGWMFLNQAQIASEKLNTIFINEGVVDRVQPGQIVNNDPDAIFYTSKIHTAKYFIGSVLPQVKGKIDAIFKNDDTLMKMENRFFVA